MAAAATSASILRAQVLAKSVTNGIFDAEKTIASNKEQQKLAAEREKEQAQNLARAKISRNEAIVKGDEERIFGSDGAIKKATAVIRNLQHARYAHFSASQVTERRLQLRSERIVHLRKAGSGTRNGERPSTVPRHDAVQMALEREQGTLISAREKLQELEQQTKAVMNSLEEVRGYLSQDAAKRRHSVEQERAYIISFGSVTGKPLPSPPDIDENEVAKALAMQEHVYGLEDKVKQMESLSANEIKRYQKDYARHHFQLEEELTKSTSALDSLGRRLKGQAKEVDTTTRMAERSLGEIKKKNLTKGDDVSSAKVAALETLVDDLRLTREALQEDIRSKSYLLDIDERCRKVTTVGEKLFADRHAEGIKKMQKHRSAPSLRMSGENFMRQA